jgi:cysteine desulfurase family protein (TIGR01976 family)
MQVDLIRRRFPALQRTVNGRVPIFLDGPGGTQVPQAVVDATVHYLTTCNANHGGFFTTSRLSDEMTHAAQQAAADLLHAPALDEIVFGANMTTLTLHLSHSFARTLRPGDQVLVTRLDHDANVSPWVLAARDAGAEAVFIDIHPEDCTLDIEDFRRKLNPRVRLVALGCASNLVGTVNDVRTLTQLAHEAGALVYLDAVHYAPHGLIDVQAWDCDFLACSAYKFFGPHVGILWGRRRLLTELPAYKVRPASEDLPDRWMTGTPNLEGLAGTLAAIDYLASLAPASAGPGRRARLEAAFREIQQYERELARRLLAGLAERPRFRVWGITDPNRLGERVPTLALTAQERTPAELAQHLAGCEMYTWNGNMYALELTERLGLEEKGGVLRVGLLHYNTADEVDRLLAALEEL